MIQELELPWPPSVNHYYRHIGPRVLISREGRQYREKVIAILAGLGIKKLQGKLSLKGEFYPPDRRRRDLDNLLKCLLDALTIGGAYEDDSQIKEIHLTMREPIQDGLVYIKIEVI